MFVNLLHGKLVAILSVLVMKTLLY